MKLLDNVEIYNFVISYRVTALLRLPKYIGNLLRGLLGYSLRSIYCKNPDESDCSKCYLKNDCEFAFFFQGIFPHKENLPLKYKKFSNFPSMFSITPIGYNGYKVLFEINFLGDIYNYLPIFIEMLENTKGFKPDKYSDGRLIFDSIVSGENIYYYQGRLISNDFKKYQFKKYNTDKFLLHFSTPTRIVHKGKHIMDDLNGEIISKKVIERTELLLSIYSSVRDFPKIETQSIEIIDKRLKWYDISHRSSRQRSKIKLGGFVGDIKIRVLDPNIIPYLQILELMHLGTNVKAGYGKFEIFEM